MYVGQVFTSQHVRSVYCNLKFIHFVKTSVDPETLLIRISFSISYCIWMVSKGFPRPTPGWSP